jgi:hypothetical protein
MIQDPASLDRLRDIAEPDPVSWWPLAPGWWLMLAVITIAVVFFAVRFCRKWQANAYRRAALRELESSTTAAEIHRLLKRTALAAFPRGQVASLSGQAWCDWLGQTAAMEVPPAAAQTMTVGVYQDAQPNELGEALRVAAYWIKHHQASQTSDPPC